MTATTHSFSPFANSRSSAALGDFTIENGTERIGMYGELAIMRDKEGLRMALALKEHVDAIVAALQAAADLPDKLDAAAPDAPDQVANPFQKKD